MLLDQIQNELKQAQLNREEVKVLTLRLLLSEVKNAQINKGESLSDQEIISIIQKEVKKRHESVTSFRSGGRDDLALKEEAEIEVLKIYLPEQMLKEELVKIVEDTIKELAATSITDMGKVIGAVMTKIAGRADGSTVSALVREKLLNG